MNRQQTDHERIDKLPSWLIISEIKIFDTNLVETNNGDISIKLL